MSTPERQTFSATKEVLERIYWSGFSSGMLSALGSIDPDPENIDLEATRKIADTQSQLAYHVLADDAWRGILGYLSEVQVPATVKLVEVISVGDNPAGAPGPEMPR